MDWNEAAWSDREHGTITEEEQEAMDAYVTAMRWYKGEKHHQIRALRYFIPSLQSIIEMTIQ